MLTLRDLATVLAPFPGLDSTLTLDAVHRFIRLAQHLRREIEINTSGDHIYPPPCLPAYIHDFLCHALGLRDDAAVIYCWKAFKDVIWQSKHAIEALSAHDIHLFWAHTCLSHARERLGALCCISACLHDS